MEAKEMNLKDWKGEGRDEDWTAFNCLAEVAVAVAAIEEENEKERLMMGTTSQKEGFKIDNIAANNNSPDLPNDKPILFNHQAKLPWKRCFECGEPSGIKNLKLKKQKQCNIGIFGPGDRLLQPTVLPEILKKMIKDMEGTDEKLIIQKSLSKTDCYKRRGRLSIPMKQVKVEFLTDEEENVLKEGIGERYSIGIKVMVIEPCLRTRGMVFRRYNMKAASSGKTWSIYALLRGWNSVVKDNDLKVNDVIQLWSFRVNSRLHFALVIV